jgi:protein involved in polysaccharide export with SLBB domain
MIKHLSRLGHLFCYNITATFTNKQGLPIVMKPRVNGANRTIMQQIYLRWLLVMSLLVVSSSVWSQENPIAESDVSYRLGAGDKVQINVFNQANLSGEYTLDGNGRFTMHLIGKVEAANLTPTELEILLVSKLKPDYLVNPRVSVRMENFRPFYIMGEVNNPASYNYVDGMTYLNAVAIAGGYTYRGRKKHIYVIRGDDPERIELKLEVGEKVQPGDIIRVAERLF